MTRSKKIVSLVAGLATLTAIAIPVYAHCGTCAGSAKAIAAAMDAGKISLSAAVTAAETAAKGKAVAVLSGMHDGKLQVDVFVSAGDKLQVVSVDSSGAAGSPKDAKELPHGHGHHAPEKKPAPRGG
jgi:hypothetical protein